MHRTSVLQTAAVLLAAVTLPLLAGVRPSAAHADERTPATTGSAASGGVIPGATTASAPPVTPTATAGEAGGTPPEAPARVRATITRFRLTTQTWRKGAAAPQVQVRIDARRRTAARVQLRIEDRATRKLLFRQSFGTVPSGVDVARHVTARLAAKPGRYRLRLVVKDATGQRARRDGVPVAWGLRVTAPATATPTATPTPIAGGNYVFPVQGRCNFRSVPAQRFHAGRSGGRLHNGQDIGTYDAFPPVVAVTAGTISRVWYDDYGGGWTLTIDGDDRIAYGYLHLKQGSILVKAGQRVTPGQRVANAGNTGGDYEPHLHFEMRPIPWEANRDRAIDPLPFLSKLPNPCDG
ncbi:M23 family metallopeptidase [Patulibacter defluvii]|uniref:M23 family metallopeptidase n=1 Tax=Patulibacter defluvii TaxID=3095358 RepID=UPI002A75330B|nr:peptidoglycan DD-metalloendopeptidase family protein [Patulibacter sp. DM4]